MTALRPERGDNAPAWEPSPWDDDGDRGRDRPPSEAQTDGSETIALRLPPGGLAAAPGSAGTAGSASAAGPAAGGPGSAAAGSKRGPWGQDEDFRTQQLSVYQPEPESSATITLRVPPGSLPLLPTYPVPAADAAGDVAGHVAGESAAGSAAGPDREPAPGGRAARRKAEQQSRRRGGRRQAPGAGGAVQPKVKESPAIIAVRVMGELFITLGVVLFLFVAYQLWWTNVQADQYAKGSEAKLEQQWQPAAPGSTSHPAYPTSIAPGTTFAIIYIPKLDVKTSIAEGVDKDSILDHGLVGHYTGAQETAFPWAATGNFALAGHRNTHGEPFRNIDKLVPGDKVVVETAYDYYTYTVTSTLPSTSPSNVSVIEPVPPGSGFTGPGRYITLTTCTPDFTSTYRLIVWGKMTQDLPKSSGQVPQALQSG